MACNEDSYVSAAIRHARDAQALHTDGSYDNAVYVGGYAVETVLKGWIEAETKNVSRTHDLAHLEVVALAATVHRVDRHGTFPTSAIAAARALRWSPETRYWPTGRRSESDSRGLVDALQRMVRDTIRPLILDGTLTL